MPKYKITIAYDGTQYSGWQIQPNAVSIQEKLQEAISLIVKDKTSITGAGRTDAGVHALHQAAHFSTENPLDQNKFLLSINGLLPPDIRVNQISEVQDSFHARYSAKGKVYHYNIHQERHGNPFNRLYALHFWTKIDIDLLKKAAALFIGTHDFTSFANESNKGAAQKNPIRTIKRLDVVQVKDGLRLEFEGESFLYKMVRNIVGMLLDVARGKRPIDDIPKVLKAKDRRLASRAAPAKGLFLAQIDYPDT